MKLFFKSVVVLASFTGSVCAFGTGEDEKVLTVDVAIYPFSTKVNTLTIEGVQVTGDQNKPLGSLRFEPKVIPLAQEFRSVHHLGAHLFDTYCAPEAAGSLPVKYFPFKNNPSSITIGNATPTAIQKVESSYKIPNNANAFVISINCAE